MKKRKKDAEDKIKEEMKEFEETVRAGAFGLPDSKNEHYCPKCGHHWWENAPSLEASIN